MANSKANLEATQHDLQQAWNKISAAEKANEFDADGHAKKAKELINQAYQELRLAAQPVAADSETVDKK